MMVSEIERGRRRRFERMQSREPSADGSLERAGLFIFDILRQPQVCSAWPAVWMTSMTQQWPKGGEIDIVEYVGHQTE